MAKKGVLGQVGHVERFNPAFRAIKSSVAAKIYRIPSFIRIQPRGTDVPVVLDLMIHDIDLLLTVVDAKIKSISASGVAVISNTPDITNARIEFENGW